MHNKPIYIESTIHWGFEIMDIDIAASDPIDDGIMAFIVNKDLAKDNCPNCLSVIDAWACKLVCRNCGLSFTCDE